MEIKTIKQTIATNLFKYRKRKKMTQKELAEKLGVQHNTISTWENGINSIDVDTLYKICIILDISINDIFGYKEKGTFSLKEKEHLNKYKQLNDKRQNRIDKFTDIELEEQKEELRSSSESFLK